MAARSIPYGRGRLSRNSKDLAGGEAGPGRPVRVRVTDCKSIIAVPAECYLLFGNGGLHGAAPCGDAGPSVQRGTSRTEPAADVAPARGMAEEVRPKRKGNCLYEHHHGHDE